MRRLVLLILVSLTFAIPTQAEAAKLWVNSEGDWIHFPTRDFTWCYGSSLDAQEEIRSGNWNGMYDWASQTILRTEKVPCTEAMVKVKGQWLGETGRSGYVYMPPTGDERAIITYNLTYVADGRATWTERLTIGCHEWGHVFGLDHYSGDCMGAGYFSSWTALPGEDALALIDASYAVYP